MDQLFETSPTKRDHLASREELSELVHSGIATISLLRRQITDLQREVDALRLELGYGQTLHIPFAEENSKPNSPDHQSA